MNRRRKRRQTGRTVGLCLLGALLFILTGLAGWILCFGKNGYREREITYEAVSGSITVENKKADVSGENKGEEHDAGHIFDSPDDGSPVSIKLETEADGKMQGNGTGPGHDSGPGNALENAGETVEIKSNGNIVLLFAGDVYLSSHVLNAYEKAGGIHGVLDGKIRQEIEEADLFMVNQEFPFTDRGTPAADKQFTFRIPTDRVHILTEMGIDMVTLANNHILDYGEEGLLDSCEVLDEAGILHVGAGKNLDEARKLKTVRTGGKTIGFLGTSRVYMDGSWAAGAGHPGVFSTYDSRQAVADIKAARESCDYLVVYVHWGAEKETVPKDYQRTMGREYIDAGADLVIGSHPHVLQEIEYYKGKPIVHSLGNFVFGSSIPETELLKVVITEDGAELTELPCTSSGGYTRMK